MTGDTLSLNPEDLPQIERQIASVIIISKDGKIPMGRKDPAKGGVYPDAWHIPGGGTEEGDTLEATARREALEETGIDLADATLVPVPFVGQGETTKTLSTGQRVWCRMTFNRFEARLDRVATEITVQPGDDLVELRWFDRDELANVEQIPGGKEFFEQAGYL